ncbi:MAG: hypothetical protein FWC12_12145 [Treponema sp.]|nr:hypothetical protein [Treponema sp.]
MGSIRSHYINFQTIPPLPQGSVVNFNVSNIPLLFNGLNIQVIVSTATAFHNPNNPQSIKSSQILAHFDTGASKTSIDIELAKHLSLIPTEESPSNTAAGLRQATDFVIDLSFPGASLQSFRNLQISSCELSNPVMSLPFKMLIGRDIMSRWNIVWDGPTSTVIISD